MVAEVRREARLALAALGVGDPVDAAVVWRLSADGDDVSLEGAGFPDGVGLVGELFAGEVDCSAQALGVLEEDGGEVLGDVGEDGSCSPAQLCQLADLVVGLVNVGALALALVEGLVSAVFVGTGDEGGVVSLACVVVEVVGVARVADVSSAEPAGDDGGAEPRVKLDHALKVELAAGGCEFLGEAQVADRHGAPAAVAWLLPEVDDAVSIVVKVVREGQCLQVVAVRPSGEAVDEAAGHGS